MARDICTVFTSTIIYMYIALLCMDVKRSKSATYNFPHAGIQLPAHHGHELRQCMQTLQSYGHQ